MLYYYSTLYIALFFTVKHIKSVDGFTGCYRGLVPKVCAYTVGTIACDKTLEYLTNPEEKNEDEDERDESVKYVLRKGRKMQIVNV